MEADVLHRSSSLFQHSVQLALGGSKNLEVVDIQEIGDFDSYRWDNRYPYVARMRHGTGFRHSVNNLGHKASPWGSPFMNLIFLEVSRPYLLVTTTYSSIPARTQLAYDLTQPDGKPVYVSHCA